jgi:hypothetical protein
MAAELGILIAAGALFMTAAGAVLTAVVSHTRLKTLFEERTGHLCGQLEEVKQAIGQSIRRPEFEDRSTTLAGEIDELKGSVARLMPRTECDIREAAQDREIAAIQALAREASRRVEQHRNLGGA